MAKLVLVFFLCSACSILGAFVGAALVVGWPFSQPNARFALLVGLGGGALFTLGTVAFRRYFSRNMKSALLLSGVAAFITAGGVLWFLFSKSAAV